MATPFDIFGVVGRTGKKHVAALHLPYGLLTGLSNTTLVTASTVTTADAVPNGSERIYNGMLEYPAGSGIFDGQCDVTGWPLPPSTNRPYTVEVREVDDATDIGNYAACSAAFEASELVRYSRAVPETMGQGYLLSDGNWSSRVDVRAVNGDPDVVAVAQPFAIQGAMQAILTNPRYQTRDLPPIAQGSEPTDVWAMTDAQGVPINLTGKTFRFVAYVRTDTGTDQESVLDDTITPSFEYESGDGITLEGPSFNQVTLHHDAARTATPGNYRYWLWNVTDKLVLAKGRCPIEPAVFDA